MSAQEAEVVDGTTEISTEIEDSKAPVEALAPESEGQDTPEQPNLDPNNPEGQKAPEIDLESEQVIEFGGKTYTLKGKEIQAILENQSALTEKEKALNRDYTQKTQKLAQERKSFESAFGKVPEPQELQALGKLYQSYFQNESVAKVIDAIISGQSLESVLNGQAGHSKNPVNPEVASLQNHIKRLEGQLSQFLTTSEQKEQQALASEGKRIFDTWLESKTKSGAKIDESMIDPILDWAGFLRNKNPSWDSSRALDEAYRHVTIDSVEKTAASKVFAKADAAKKAPTIKITPKSSVKNDSNSGYKDIFRSAM